MSNLTRLYGLMFLVSAVSLAAPGITEPWEAVMRVDSFKGMDKLSYASEIAPLDVIEFDLKEASDKDLIYGWRDQKPVGVWTSTKTVRIWEDGTSIVIRLEKVNYSEEDLEYRVRLSDAEGEIFVMEAKSAEELDKAQVRRVRYRVPKTQKVLTLDITFDRVH